MDLALLIVVLAMQNFSKSIFNPCKYTSSLSITLTRQLMSDPVPIEAEVGRPTRTKGEPVSPLPPFTLYPLTLITESKRVASQGKPPGGNAIFERKERRKKERKDKKQKKADYFQRYIGRGWTWVGGVV